MTRLRYPIGIQTFSEIIENGYAYIDKTVFIPDLLAHGKYLFLSRPRRFGKSLLLSTLEAYFEGRRDLFRGLAIDGMDNDWTPTPVLHFDFNSENFTREDGLEKLMDVLLKNHEKKYGRDIDLTTPAQRFRYIIQAAYEQTGRKVAILIDEYDKPLLAIENNRAMLEKNQAILKSFFGNLKSMDKFIRFAFITGVARFSKVSIFSDLNNLDDISMEDKFADICGWTEEELLGTFTPGIEELAVKEGNSFETTVKELREYYDGYLFTPKGSRLYNPFSVLRALKAKDFSAFWFSTGSPDFLVKRVVKNGIPPYDIAGQVCDREDLMSVGIADRNPIPLMFQTGYLTIESYDRNSKLFTLRFPNKEVEIGFYKDLLPLYSPESELSSSPFNFVKFKQDLFNGKPEE